MVTGTTDAQLDSCTREDGIGRGRIFGGRVDDERGRKRHVAAVRSALNVMT
jgi:hypothetical protein